MSIRRTFPRLYRVPKPRNGGALEGTDVLGDFGRSFMVCLDSMGIISRSKEQQFALNIRLVSGELRLFVKLDRSGDFV